VESHAHYEQDLGAYLLGALSSEEEAAFELHLEACEPCRAEVERLRVAADALPRSVEPFAPPPSLKSSLMRAVREDAEARGETPARRPLIERLGLGRGMRPQLALAGAVLLLVVGGLAGFAIEKSSSGGSGQRTIAATVDTMKVPRASASLVIPRHGSGVAQLRVRGLPSPGPGHIYEVWLKRGTQLEHSSLFSVAADGSGAAGIPQSLDGVAAVLVTREQGPEGALAPSRAPIISVKT
jgi:hypothetical protein